MLLRRPLRSHAGRIRKRTVQEHPRRKDWLKTVKVDYRPTMVHTSESTSADIGWEIGSDQTKGEAGHERAPRLEVLKLTSFV